MTDKEIQHIDKIAGERIKLTSLADFMKAIDSVEDQDVPRKVLLKWEWLCLCSYCQAELTLPSTTLFDKEKHKCPKCKKKFFGYRLRGLCEQVKSSDP